MVSLESTTKILNRSKEGELIGRMIALKFVIDESKERLVKISIPIDQDELDSWSHIIRRLLRPKAVKGIIDDVVPTVLPYFEIGGKTDEEFQTFVDKSLTAIRSLDKKIIADRKEEIENRDKEILLNQSRKEMADAELAATQEKRKREQIESDERLKMRELELAASREVDRVQKLKDELKAILDVDLSGVVKEASDHFDELDEFRNTTVEFKEIIAVKWKITCLKSDIEKKLSEMAEANKNQGSTTVEEVLKFAMMAGKKIDPMMLMMMGSGKKIDPMMLAMMMSNNNGGEMSMLAMLPLLMNQNKRG